MPDFPAASGDTAGAALIVPSTTYYLSLHTTDPSTTGANEVTGGSYARQPITFGAWSAGSTASTNAQVFSGMPSESGNLWGAIWTTVSGGTFIWGDPTAMVTGPVAGGATVNFAIAAITAGPFN